MVKEKRKLIEPYRVDISIARQCELLGLPKSTFYYTPAQESPGNLLLMRVIDEIYTSHPYYGKRRITRTANTKYNHLLNAPVGVKRVARLLGIMGLEALYSKPKLSNPGKNSDIFPYLLRGVKVVEPNQVWATDITYIRMNSGFLYLVVVMDWFSRYVISWELSNSQDTEFCIRALEKALGTGKPEIFNSDQGSQFTSKAFTGRLKDHDVRISMNGKGRCHDNIFVERLWGSVKREEVYLNDYMTGVDAYKGLKGFFEFYNHDRPHQSFNYKTPSEVYNGGFR